MRTIPVFWNKQQESNLLMAHPIRIDINHGISRIANFPKKLFRHLLTTCEKRFEIGPHGKI